MDKCKGHVQYDDTYKTMIIIIKEEESAGPY